MPKRLLILNGLSILGVILFHAEGWGFTAMFAWSHRYVSAELPLHAYSVPVSYVSMRAIEQLVSFSIPAFLFVTGFFVAFSTGRNQQTIDRKIVLARVKHLAIPYLFWSALLWVSFGLQGRQLGVADYARLLATGATNPAYYYVPLVIQYYLLAPVIVYLARRHWKALLIVTGIFQLTLHALQYPGLLGVQWPAVQLVASAMPKWLFTYRLFWFCVGIVAGFHITELKLILSRLRWVTLASAALLFVAGLVEWEIIAGLGGQRSIAMSETVVDAFYAGAVIAAFLGFGDFRWPAAEALTTLGIKSYGIYLVHSPLMEFFSRGVYHLAPWLLGYPLVLITLLIVVGLGGPLLLMYLVGRSPARSLYVYQFG